MNLVPLPAAFHARLQTTPYHDAVNTIIARAYNEGAGGTAKARGRVTKALDGIKLNLEAQAWIA